jgi:hypothetical protein
MSRSIDSNLLIVIIRVSSINVIYNIRRVWRYQNGIEEGQTTQWPKEKDRQNNDQKKKDKKTNNDLQNITHKTKDQVTRIPL